MVTSLFTVQCGLKHVLLFPLPENAIDVHHPMSKTQQKCLSFSSSEKNWELGKPRQVFKAFDVTEKRGGCFWGKKKRRWTKQYFHFCQNLPRCQSVSVGISFRIGVKHVLTCCDFHFFPLMNFVPSCL